MKKYFPSMIVIVFAVLLAMTWVITNNSDQSTIKEPLTHVSGQVDTRDEATLDSDEVLDELITGNKYAKRIVRTPDKIAEISDAEHEIDIEFQEAVKKMVESALTGNAEDAIASSNLMKQCNTGFKEDQVQKYLADFSTMKFTSETIIQFGNGQQVTFDSLESVKAFLWKKHDQCRAVKNLLKDDLRERIKMLADNGMVTARYIYALWPPKGVGVVSEDTLELLQYQHRALEYTWRNIDEREPLGVLAFARSYAAITPGFFTPFNYMQGLNFLLAARKCGLNSSWLDAEIQAKLEQRMRFSDPENLEIFIPTLEAAADEIKKLFCD